jgi:NAD(P)-dependent dehydrogenase (short-subunit alcohol dehydrogenase family)
LTVVTLKAYMKITVLVVGAGGGGGRALVKMLVDAGYDVIGTVLNDEEKSAVQIACAGIRKLVNVDLANNSQLSTALDAILRDRKIAALAAVIVCAGISPFGPLEITPVERLRLAFEINTVAGVTIYQKCLPLLRHSKGRYIVTSSMAGKVGIPFIGYYSASKFALESLADVMRREAQQWHVDVIIVEPGSIKTAMVSDQISQVEKSLKRLSGANQKLYGHMYRQWHKIVSAGYEAAIPPQRFAVSVMRALTSQRPRTRYVSDSVARTWISAANRMNDRELDNFIHKEMGLTPKPRSR